MEVRNVMVVMENADEMEDAFGMAEEAGFKIGPIVKTALRNRGSGVMILRTPAHVSAATWADINYVPTESSDARNFPRVTLGRKTVIEARPYVQKVIEHNGRKYRLIEE